MFYFFYWIECQDDKNLYDPEPKKSNVNLQKIGTTRTPEKNCWFSRKRKGSLKKKKPETPRELLDELSELSLSPQKKKALQIRKLKHHLTGLNCHKVQGRETNRMKGKGIME